MTPHSADAPCSRRACPMARQATASVSPVRLGGASTGASTGAGDRAERRDLALWAGATLAGLVFTYAAVRAGAALGTASAPFLGSYRFALGLGSVLAPAVAA